MATDLTSTTTAIDDLPESIILHIFSFLPTMDAIINISAVSSKWRHLSLSIPKLDLCIVSFTSRFNHSPSSSIEIPQLFAEFVNRVVSNRRRRLSSSLHEFRLSFYYKDTGYYTYHVDNWIRYAVNSNCKVLFLNPKEEGWTSRKSLPIAPLNTYKFDFSSLLNSSVQVLNLTRCDFCFPSTSISSLKSLYLVTDPLCMDASMVSGLLPLCVNLEFLSLHGFVFADCFKIESLSLKELVLSIRCGILVEICAPNLRIVSLDSSNLVRQLMVRDAMSLVEASVHISFTGSRSKKTLARWNNLIASLPNVKRLTVQNMWSWYNDLFGDASFFKNIAFNNLKYLKLLTGYRKLDVLGLELCLEMCPKLETLELELCLETLGLEWCLETCPDRDDLQLKHKLFPEVKLDDVDDLIEMEKRRPIILQVQNLRHIKLRNFKGTGNELFVVELLRKHMVVLENIIAFPAKENGSLGKPIILWSPVQPLRSV